MLRYPVNDMQSTRMPWHPEPSMRDAHLQRDPERMVAFTDQMNMDTLWGGGAVDYDAGLRFVQNVRHLPEGKPRPSFGPPRGLQWSPFV